jgi:hypothetical protein
MRQRQPSLRVARILAADEFTHDVLVAFDGGRYLVYDTT